MNGHLPEHALAFQNLYMRVEHVLRRNEYCLPNRKKALIDWQKFAHDLGDQFFDYVRESQAASTLINKPPRAYYRQDGWPLQDQTPIQNVVGLFERGVCQVRNNIVHGEKYIEPEHERSDILVIEAHWVLEQAILRHPEAKKIFHGEISGLRP